MPLFYQVLDKNFRTANATYDLAIDYDNNIYTIDLAMRIPAPYANTPLLLYYTLRESNPTLFALRLRKIEKNDLIRPGLIASETAALAEELTVTINREIKKFHNQRRAIYTIAPLQAYL